MKELIGNLIKPELTKKCDHEDFYLSDGLYRELEQYPIYSI